MLIPFEVQWGSLFGIRVRFWKEFATYIQVLKFVRFHFDVGGDGFRYDLVFPILIVSRHEFATFEALDSSGLKPERKWPCETVTPIYFNNFVSVVFEIQEYFWVKCIFWVTSTETNLKQKKLPENARKKLLWRCLKMLKLQNYSNIWS